tara:strand:- start:14296 stop:14523 length:228 start_codon:yes stop_codon:yes gene_type:complete
MSMEGLTDNGVAPEEGNVTREGLLLYRTEGYLNKLKYSLQQLEDGFEGTEHTGLFRSIQDMSEWVEKIRKEIKNG